jgi:alcohol dehydrogenase
MKAAVCENVNAKWQIKNIDNPKLSPNDVLIKIHASGLCYTDVHLTEGAFGDMVKYPCVFGHEPVGEIVEIGKAVKSRKIGDRVGVAWTQDSCGRCEWCLRDKKFFCKEQIVTGIHHHGSHAEYMLAPADSTMLLPEGLAYEQAAPIFCAGYTVYSGLRFADPKPHEKIAVVGVGGLGHLAVQYSKASGFDTIAVTHSSDKADLIKKLGADEVVQSGEQLLALGGADVILSTTNSYKAMMDAAKGIRPDGRIIWMGISGEQLVVPIDLFMKRARLIPSTQNSREHLYEALEFAARGRVKVISEIYSLNDIGKAYDRVASGKVRFRAVITM